MKIILKQLPLSRFLAQTLRVNKSGMKNFVWKLSHVTCVVEKLGHNPDSRFVMANYVRKIEDTYERKVFLLRLR